MMPSFWKPSQLLLGTILGAIAWLPNSQLTAQTIAPQPSQAPLELSLTRSNSNWDRQTITSNTSQDSLTIPSLWWAKEQYGGEVLSNWLVYPAQDGDPGRIDLLVNRQNWNSLDYIQQYEFVNHFGTEAMDRGYNLRVFNEQKQLLASYTCDFSTSSTPCNIQLDANSKSMVRGGNQLGMMR